MTEKIKKHFPGLGYQTPPPLEATDEDEEILEEDDGAESDYEDAEYLESNIDTVVEETSSDTKKVLDDDPRVIRDYRGEPILINGKPLVLAVDPKIARRINPSAGKANKNKK